MEIKRFDFIRAVAIHCLMWFLFFALTFMTKSSLPNHAWESFVSYSLCLAIGIELSSLFIKVFNIEMATYRQWLVINFLIIIPLTLYRMAISYYSFWQEIILFLILWLIGSATSWDKQKNIG